MGSPCGNFSHMIFYIFNEYQYVPNERFDIQDFPLPNPCKVERLFLMGLMLPIYNTCNPLLSHPNYQYI